MGGYSRHYDQVRRRDPEPEDLKRLRGQVYDMVSPALSKATAQADWNRTRAETQKAWAGFASANKALPSYMAEVNKAADGLGALADGAKDYAPYRAKLDRSAQDLGALASQAQNYGGKIERATGLLSDYGAKMARLADTGKVSQGLTDTLNASVARAMRQSMGESLNDLAGRGVLNSSIANRSFNQMNDAAADAYAKNYQATYNMALNALQGAADTAKAGIGGYQAAAGTLRDAMSGRTAQLQAHQAGLDSVTRQLEGARAAKSAALDGYRSALGAGQALAQNWLNAPRQIVDSAMAPYMPAFNLWKEHQNSYDRKEDFDTIVRQGK